MTATTTTTTAYARTTERMECEIKMASSDVSVYNIIWGHDEKGAVARWEKERRGKRVAVELIKNKTRKKPGTYLSISDYWNSSSETYYYIFTNVFFSFHRACIDARLKNDFDLAPIHAPHSYYYIVQFLFCFYYYAIFTIYRPRDVHNKTIRLRRRPSYQYNTLFDTTFPNKKSIIIRVRLQKKKKNIQTSIDKK